MSPQRSLPRKVFDFSILIGGIALVAFIIHSAFIGTTVFPLGVPEEKKAVVATLSVVANYILGSITCLAFVTMLGCGFYCTYTGEMDLTLD